MRSVGIKQYWQIKQRFTRSEQNPKEKLWSVYLSKQVTYTERLENELAQRGRVSGTKETTGAKESLASGTCSELGHGYSRGMEEHVTLHMASHWATGPIDTAGALGTQQRHGSLLHSHGKRLAVFLPYIFQFYSQNNVWSPLMSEYSLGIEHSSTPSLMWCVVAVAGPSCMDPRKCGMDPLTCWDSHLRRWEELSGQALELFVPARHSTYLTVPHAPALWLPRHLSRHVCKRLYVHPPLEPWQIL